MTGTYMYRRHRPERWAAVAWRRDGIRKVSDGVTSIRNQKRLSFGSTEAYIAAQTCYINKMSILHTGDARATVFLKQRLDMDIQWGNAALWWSRWLRATLSRTDSGVLLF